MHVTLLLLPLRKITFTTHFKNNFMYLYPVVVSIKSIKTVIVSIFHVNSQCSKLHFEQYDVASNAK